MRNSCLLKHMLTMGKDCLNHGYLIISKSTSKNKKRHSGDKFNMLSVINMTINDILPELKIIYDELPGVPCKECGRCCVSPTCTLVEFIFLIKSLLSYQTNENVQKLLSRNPLLHDGFDGNLHCVFQDIVSKKCIIHSGRTLACRFFGFPALDDLNISNLENCREITLPGNGPGVKDIRSWLDRLTALNQHLTPYYCEPYWIAGFNVECWLAVYFDPMLNEGIFGEMKNVLRASIDLEFMDSGYVDITGLKEKTDRIALLYELIRAGDKPGSLHLIQDIRTNYPYTGSYYLDELDKLGKLLLD